MMHGSMLASLLLNIKSVNTDTLCTVTCPTCLEVERKSITLKSVTESSGVVPSSQSSSYAVYPNISCIVICGNYEVHYLLHVRGDCMYTCFSVCLELMKMGFFDSFGTKCLYGCSAGVGLSGSPVLNSAVTEEIAKNKLSCASYY